MEKLIVLIAGSGEYSDRWESPIGCFKTPGEAWAYADWLKQKRGGYDYQIAEIPVFATLQEAVSHGIPQWPDRVDEDDRAEGRRRDLHDGLGQPILNFDELKRQS